MKTKSIVLLSGGLDSSLSFTMALQESQIQFGLTFDYGQKSNIQEIQAAQNICAHYGIKHKTINLPFFTALTDHPFFNREKDCPEPGLENLDDLKTTTKSAKAVWVPNRNGIFLNVAAALAEIENVDYLYVGFNAEEATTFPDNSKDYVTKLNESLSYSTLNKVKAIAPTIDMNKKEILHQLMQKDFPLTLLWSCYHNQEKMCGRCESCQRLKRAFKNNNLENMINDLFS